MKRASNIIINLTLALNVLLAFLLLFESRIALPGWLQVAGRMHPLVLHFPIVLVSAFCIWQIVALLYPQIQRSSAYILLVVAALLTAFTALCGLMLSLENGESGTTMQWHKWGGSILSFAMLAVMGSYGFFQKRRRLNLVLSLVLLAGITATGHWGATITHGENFLTGPLLRGGEKPAVLLEDAMVFEHMVNPILEAKCMNCHNENKAKGELIMQTQAALLKGGKTGPLWDLNAPGFGLMMKRLHLPMDVEEHMPPSGKPQLTEDELTILSQWITKGASFNQKVNDLEEGDTLKMLAQKIFSKLEEEVFAFDAAAPDVINKLNTPNRIIYSLATGSPALVVEFYGGSLFKEEQLKELAALRNQIVSINLNKMPLTDKGMQELGKFTELRKLFVGFTDITDAGLPALKSLPHLQQLTVSGTAVTAKGLQSLAEMDALSTIYAWETGIALQDRPKFADKNIVWGYYGDTLIMQLNAPIIQNTEQVITNPITLKLKHYVPGAALRYTLDGTDPDSVNSPLYNGKVMISEQGLLKARAFKNGWLSSSITEMFFYKNKYQADTIIALQPPDNAYPGNGAKTLADLVKSENNFRNRKWLGYKENDLDVLLQFDSTVAVSRVVLSGLVDIGSYIMPPVKIEVYGGLSRNSMKLLKSIAPIQPDKDAPSYLHGYELQCPATQVQYLRVVAKPVKVLPQWHRGRGDKGWVFADEIFVN